MLSGTIAALGYPLRKQIAITATRILGSAELNGLLLVDTVPGAADVGVGIPDGDSFNAGGFYQVVLTRGNPLAAIIAFSPGNTYNNGQTGQLSLNVEGAGIMVIAGPGKTWTVISSPIAVNNLLLGPFQGGSFGVPGYYALGAPEALPLAAASVGPFIVVNTTAAPHVISPSGADTLVNAAGAVGPIAIAPGGKATFKSNAISTWQEF